MMATLISAGADVNAQSDNGTGPLHFAAMNENPVACSAAIAALIWAGLQVSAKAIDGREPLHFAALNVSPAAPVAIRALVAAGADVNAQMDNCFTPLHLAASFTDAEAAIETLTALGADVNARATDWAQPLHLATLYGNAVAVGALLRAGADVSDRRTAPDDAQPLHFALNSVTAANPEPVVRLLLNAGADVRATCTWQGSVSEPIHIAAAYTSDTHSGTIQELVNAGTRQLRWWYIEPA
jgi:ankyrin repeat protein